MAISILHPKNAGSSSIPLEPKVLYHLSLDRAFAYACADVKKRERFLNIISDLTCDKNEIKFRQDVIRDLHNNPTLLEQLMSLCTRFEELRVSQRSAMKEEFRLTSERTSSMSASKNILQAQAICLKRALLFVKGFGELLSAHTLRSMGFTDFKSACLDISENTDFQKMLAFCAKYENFGTAGFLDFMFELNEDGRVEKYELIDHKHVHITDPDLKRKTFAFFKKVEEQTYLCERLYPSENDFYENLASSALADLAKLFSTISDQIFKKFSSIYRELDFYYVALNYMNALSEKGIPFCFPEISDNNVKVCELYDLYSVMSAHDPRSVVPNDIEIDKDNKGILVLGNNGSGKTVFLRSIGCMQLLAQAGLPVPSRSAEISLHPQIVTQFSEAEKEFFEGNDAGRFEQEVREFSVMVDNLREGSFVFLNETFQSTAYAEGAEGLYNLLNYFSECGIRWILVSHLRRLEALFEADGVKILHTTDGYKIV